MVSCLNVVDSHLLLHHRNRLLMSCIDHLAQPYIQSISFTLSVYQLTLHMPLWLVHIYCMIIIYQQDY
jgi:hypothetical protein